MVTINVETVAMKAQGFVAEVKVADYPQDAIDYWFTYGVRRAFQDGINSVAAKLVEAEKLVDGAALFADRDKSFRDGSFRVRGAGSGESAEETEAKSKLRTVVKSGDAKGYKNASPEERTKMVEAAWKKLPDKERESYLAWAKQSLVIKAKAAKAIAALEVGVKL